MIIRLQEVFFINSIVCLIYYLNYVLLFIKNIKL